MYLKEIWRYPVKSIAGEQLQQARLTDLGVEGDRRVAIAGPAGRWITGRQFPKLLALHGSINADGVPTIDGRPWYDPASLAAVRAASAPFAELIPVEGAESFDILPLSVATDGAVHYVGVDRRRFRPNLLIGGVESLAERQWPGGSLQIGGVVIRMEQLRARCVMVTWDPDTQQQDHGVLRRIAKELDGTLSLDSFVEEPGVVHVGDPVEWVPLVD
jgi:hypothetical protein